MSDEKNLSDDLNDMLDDAKDGAKKAADKVSEKATELAGDAKEVLSDGKNVAIIAHLTLIGWIIALVMNSSNKTELGSFYIRQVLGIGLLGFVVSFIPIVNIIGWILILILWIISLVGALGGKKKTIPVLGEHFQNWFKGL